MHHRLHVIRALALPLALFTAHLSAAAVINFQTDAGAVPNDSSLATSWTNGGILNSSLAALKPGDTFLIPNITFHVMGGCVSSGLTDAIIQIDGTLVFSGDTHQWPRSRDGSSVLECLQFNSPVNVTITSSGRGRLIGSGQSWWSLGPLGYLIHGENRPRLLHIVKGRGVIVEHIAMEQSPYWTFWAEECDGLVVRFCSITAKRDDAQKHDLYDLTAFNTDGFDVSGTNVHIHDSQVWNQDDSFCVKDGSSNMLFERLTSSGLGLTIGSIGGSTVRNITFRDIYMPDTYKGIYLKFRGSGGLITDILYENIVMDSPSQYGIWIGPAQQSDSRNLCAAHPCSICWPTDPLAQCNAPADGIYRNITLRNVTINNSVGRYGANLLINSTNPATGIVFDSVRFNNPRSNHVYLSCDGVSHGIATGDTWPVPPCFTDRTTRAAAET